MPHDIGRIDDLDQVSHLSQTVLTLITAMLSNNPLQIPSLGWLVGSQVLILASAVSRRQGREVVDFPNSSSSPADPLQRHAAAAAANLKHQLLHAAAR